MAAKKPFTFTTISYITNKSGDGSTRCQEKLTFRQDRLQDGTYHSTLIKKEIVMPVDEQTECCKKMMKHAGEGLSEYLASHSE